MANDDKATSEPKTDDTLDDICVAVLKRNADARDNLLPSPPRWAAVEYYPFGREAGQAPHTAFIIRTTDPGRVDLFDLEATSFAEAHRKGVLYLQHPDLVARGSHIPGSAGGWAYPDGSTPPQTHLSAHAKLLKDLDKRAIAGCRERQRLELERTDRLRKQQDQAAQRVA